MYHAQPQKKYCELTANTSLKTFKNNILALIHVEQNRPIEGWSFPQGEAILPNPRPSATRALPRLPALG